MAEKHSSKGIMWAVIIVAVVLIAILYPLTVKKSTSAADAASSDGDQAEVRIQPVARFQMTKAEAPAADGAPKDGPTVYNSVCGACHNTGAAGAPKLDAKAEWAPRVATGKEALYASVINGKNAMPPKGGATNLSDDEIKGAVDYILGKVQ
ncbi:MAG: cytochrome c5 family protein [Betaproteobacteria bacterium HGW-Betaproteobacteria-7]|jgi:cytochrome c5|nr:MAG: cytochrome c5 family protein [Betaproteobacteria bacterium HGW-Betaproteobacteria-7]